MNEINMFLRNVKKQIGVLSLDYPINTDKEDNLVTLKDTFDNGIDIMDDYENKVMIEMIKDSFCILDETEKIVLNFTFGINCKKKIQRDISEQLGGLSHSHICRIKAKAIKKIGKYFEDRGFNINSNLNKIRIIKK